MKTYTLYMDRVSISCLDLVLIQFNPRIFEDNIAFYCLLMYEEIYQLDIFHRGIYQCFCYIYYFRQKIYALNYQNISKDIYLL